MVGAFRRLEDIYEFPDEVPQATDYSLTDFAKHGLEAGEGLFDRIIVDAVGRQEAQRCARRLDPVTDRSALVAR